MPLTRRAALFAVAAAPFRAAVRRDAMREVAPADRVTIRAEEGWYMHSAGVESFGKELVCTYRRSDEHIASRVEIWCARSADGGRTWTDHRLICSSSFEKDAACWVAPQLGRTRDGRLLLIVDRGVKKSKYDWPMLSDWQKPDRGMSNWLFVSKDRGRTWEAPRKIDDWGGEPGYIVELASGALVYTRTESASTTAKKKPAAPWGNTYYRNVAVFSDDGGRTWPRTSVISDDPLVGDCEVGLVEYRPGRLLAMTRIGDGGGRFGQPSRMAYSADGGRTWSKPALAPIYGQRTAVHQLKSGKLLVSYRNAWGTPGSCAFVFDPEERFAYQPASFIWDESRCRLSSDALEIRSGEGREAAVEFALYPVEDDESAVEFEAELAVREAGVNACLICAGAWVRFLPTRVELADRRADGFAIDASSFHHYRIVSRGGHLRIQVDGEWKLDVANDRVFQRLVHFGNRSGVVRPNEGDGRTERKPLRGTQYEKNGGVSLWRSLRVKLENRRDHSIDWSWSPKQGYPDQFRRDRVIRLERNASFSAGDSGYSNWAQLADGSAVVVDYTSGEKGLRHPLLRAYRLGPQMLS
jgi:hypothetical protein